MLQKNKYNHTFLPHWVLLGQQKLCVQLKTDYNTSADTMVKKTSKTPQLGVVQFGENFNTEISWYLLFLFICPPIPNHLNSLSDRISALHSLEPRLWWAQTGCMKCLHLTPCSSLIILKAQLNYEVWAEPCHSFSTSLTCARCYRPYWDPIARCYLQQRPCLA